MGMVQAISASDITKIGIGVIVAIVVIGVLLGMLITAIIGRVLIAIVVIGLGAFVWQQRSTVQDAIDSHVCPPRLSFFSVHIDAPDALKHYCRSHGTGSHPHRAGHHSHHAHHHRS
ncbi:MAG TPA: hypothetical protein VFH38_04940 [Jatrophihabitans sp.]|nr:hypothetical protein [Jatrophihabitans sp.]